MKRRDTAFMLSALNIVAATILELCAINPRDQVLLGLMFGVAAVLTNNEADLCIVVKNEGGEYEHKASD